MKKKVNDPNSYNAIEAVRKGKNKQVVLKSGKWPPDKPEIVRELTPELADKIWKAMEKKRYDDKVAKEQVLHHLKQIKAQMGKEYKKFPAGFGEWEDGYADGIRNCMKMIDKKMERVKGKSQIK